MANLVVSVPGHSSSKYKYSSPLFQGYEEQEMGDANSSPFSYPYLDIRLTKEMKSTAWKTAIS